MKCLFDVFNLAMFDDMSHDIVPSLLEVYELRVELYLDVKFRKVRPEDCLIMVLANQPRVALVEKAQSSVNLRYKKENETYIGHRRSRHLPRHHVEYMQWLPSLWHLVDTAWRYGISALEKIGQDTKKAVQFERARLNSRAALSAVELRTLVDDANGNATLSKRECQNESGWPRTRLQMAKAEVMSESGACSKDCDIR